MFHRLPLTVCIVMLSGMTVLCQSSGEGWNTGVADCQPEIPPQAESNATMVTLQMHQWAWIENLTSLDWAPRIQSGFMYYELLRPGYVMTTVLIPLTIRPVIFVNVSFVTNGDTLCAAALTQNLNRTTGNITARVSCSRICFDNFTRLGARAQLPLAVFDDWPSMRRSSEYLAFDAVDPDSRTAYKCMGEFRDRPMRDFLAIRNVEENCGAGEECLFGFEPKSGFIMAGCRDSFRDLRWCYSNVSLCNLDTDNPCYVCCRDDFCNRAAGQMAYLKWLAVVTTTSNPRDMTTKTGAAAASSWQMLGVSTACLSLILQL